MKRSLFTLAVAFCAAASVGCGRKSTAESGTVTVDFHDCEERPIAEIGDAFYSSKRYVALHSDDPNLMLADAEKVIVHGDRIFVTQTGYGPRRDNRLVVHDSDGRALARIGYQGRGPGEYLQISDFDVDDAGRVHLYDNTNGVKKIFIYSADGKFEGERQMPFSADFFNCTADGGYIFVLSPWENGEHAGRMFVRTDADMKATNASGEWDMEHTDPNVYIAHGYLAETPEGLFYQRSPDETIYRVDEDGDSAAAWFLDFGRYAVPATVRADLENFMMSEERKQYRWPGLVVPWGGYLFGYTQGGVPTIFAYDVKAGVNYTLAGEYGDFGVPVSLSDGRLVTTFYLDGESPSDLPEEMRTGVATGDPLLCLYGLK